MKNINEIVIEKYNQSIDLGIKYKTQYENLLDFYGENIPQSICEQFEDNPYKDYIFETITSHNTIDLKASIKKYFNHDIKSVRNYSGSHGKHSITLDTKSGKTAKDLMNDEDFKNMLNFHGYYISDNIIDNILFIEPTYAQKVKLKRNEQLYHFTETNNLESIMTNGLRCKSSRYRVFPKRIYLYKINENILQNNGELTDAAREFANTVCNEFEDRCILKIDLSQTNIPLYEDTAIKEKNAVYTYNNIPASCITLFKEKI